MALAEKLKGSSSLSSLSWAMALGEGVVYGFEYSRSGEFPSCMWSKNNRIAQTAHRSGPFQAASRRLPPLVARAPGWIPAMCCRSAPPPGHLSEVRQKALPCLILNTCRLDHSQRRRYSPELCPTAKQSCSIHGCRLGTSERIEIEKNVNHSIERLSTGAAGILSRFSACRRVHDNRSGSLKCRTTRLTADERGPAWRRCPDPYGGAFKVTRGLSTKYPGRVLTSPISEASLVGIAAGMALRGLRPVVEIMFGDFLTLAADQITNHAAKFRWMYNDQCAYPCSSTPMGGRGYGPTHSQTLEKYFLGVPGLQVLAPCALCSPGLTTASQTLPSGSPGELLCRGILSTEDPILFIENKLLYLQPVQDESSLSEFEVKIHPEVDNNTISPYFTISLKRRLPQPDHNGLRFHGRAARNHHQLAYEQENLLRVGYPHALGSCSIQPVLDSLKRTGQLLVVEEGTLTLGWGAEIPWRC
jgi:pyruvate/2-oxoglutarate/acetoin dehydrogenase E1 component